MTADSLTLRRFTRTLATATAAFWLAAWSPPAAQAADSPASGGQGSASPADRSEKPPQILVNHVGFTPQAAKYCLISGSAPVAFEIIDAGTGQVAFTGRTAPGGPDLGLFQAGDFSALTRSGTFQVRVGNARSGSFGIAPDVYEDALRKTVAYFAKQRCGPSETGYHAPCHLDDGRRRDNGQHQDVTGGWHDACDLRLARSQGRQLADVRILDADGLLHHVAHERTLGQMKQQEVILKRSP